VVLKFSPNTPTANYFVMEPLLKPALLRNILAFRGLSTSSSKSSQSSVAESRVIKNKWRGGQKRFASTKDAPASPELANSAHLPLFLRSFEYPQRTAVCGLEEDVHHGEALMRSHHLARAISDELKVSAGESSPVAVAFVTTNTPSDLVSLYAIWLSGNIAVPVGKGPEFDDAVRDAGCRLIIAADSKSADQVGKNPRARVLVYDEVEIPKSPFVKGTTASVSDLRHSILDHYYAENQEALLLYNKDARSPLLFRHSDLNSQVDRVITAWRMSNKTSVLHALSTREPFGLITAMLAPIAAGGRVVMLKHFDTIQVWSHILGIVVNHPQPLPKVDLYPATPAHFAKLMDRYQQLFTESKEKDFVRTRCGQRIAAMVSNGQVPDEQRNRWHRATGHNIVGSLSDDACGGTVLSGNVEQAKSKKYDARSALLLPLSGVQTRLARHKRGGFGQLQVKVADQWSNVGKKTRVAKEGFEQFEEEVEGGDKRKAEKE